MKKAMFFKLLFIICIILSFFNVANAYTTTGGLAMEIDDNGLKNVTPGSNQVSITQEATYGGNKSVSFSTGKGLYTIKVTGIDAYPGEELCFVLTNSKGEEIRLAAAYNGTEYETVTDMSTANKTSTAIDVLLFSDEKYTITLSNSKAVMNPYLTGTYVDEDKPNADFKVEIVANRLGTQEDVYQSEYSSRLKSEGTQGNSIEELRDPPLDENGNIVKTKKSGSGIFSTLGDVVAGAFQGILGLAKEYLLNPLEETVAELLLSFGDFLVSLLNSLVGEEVTITNLIYNQVDAVNPNFFDKTLNGKGATAPLKDAISQWYSTFRLIAFTVYIAVLLGIGIHVLLSSTGNGLAKAKELLTQWAKGILYLIFVPYAIKYLLLINEGLVELLADTAQTPKYQIGTVFGDPEEWSAEEIEYRSPEYVSRYTGAVAYGSEEASQMYINKLSAYEQNFDLMRIMRAYAGVTKKLVYVFIWYILIGQLIVFLVMYYKRYFMIAFFIAAFPIVAIFNAISIARGKTGGEVGKWSTELISNIFTQTIHAIIYTVITGVVISIVREDMQTSATLNWILIILAINFVPQGEKLIKKIFKAISGGSTAGGVGDSAKGVKGAFNRVRSGAGRVIGGFRH